ncbi:acyl-CoA dehydrogenase NM domain-like protein [Gloeopeniophorella convolvens]|nr:acyl-CoA dehydrogenase NM domain-like protein [Gloeopeniophorella convolvens]
MFASVADDPKLSKEARARLAIERARHIAKLHPLTAQDVLLLSPKFWAMFNDPICALDSAASMHLVMQYNLCAGTIAALGNDTSADVVLKQILNFEILGQVCLAEVDHYLDALHLETTATMLPDGSFLLNTPHEGAAKCMPSTVPAGIPCVAVVFARMFARNQDHGVKPFLVHIHDGNKMIHGVVSRLLPHHGDANPMNSSLTHFNNVHLPPTALMGSINKSIDFQQAYLDATSRISAGSVTLGSLAVTHLGISCQVAARYSLRKMVHDLSGILRPNFLCLQTHRIPVLTALAQAFVLRAMRDVTISNFSQLNLDSRIRRAVATLFNVTALAHTQATNAQLVDRCGAQGGFAVNQILQFDGNFPGLHAVETDISTSSNRLMSDLLLRCYELPPTPYPESLLAKHEAGLFSQVRAHLAELGTHRRAEHDDVILSESPAILQAVGQRIAYDAARTAGVDTSLLGMYVASCARLDESWYVECFGMTRRELRALEVRAADLLLPRMDEFLALMDVKPYVTAPIASAERWSKFVAALPTFEDASASSSSSAHMTSNAASNRILPRL